MLKKVSCKEIYEFLNIKMNQEIIIQGDSSVTVSGFCSLKNPRSSCITWIKNATEESLGGFHNYDECIIVATKAIPIPMNKYCFILTDEPKATFFNILKKFWGHQQSWKVSSSAVIKTKTLPSQISIGENVYIAENVTIGENTIIGHNVVIYDNVKIGEGCIIHAGTVIGTDGFGYFIDENGFPSKVEHFGGVIIGDRVEIGANVCIDRGTIDNTEISDDVKIDNLVHIAHNVYVGKGAMVVAGAIICGSATLETNSYVAPGGIVMNQLHVGEKALVGLGAVVTKSVEKDTVVAGVPAKPIRKVKEGDR